MNLILRLLKNIIPYDAVCTIRNRKYIKDGVTIGRYVYIRESDINSTCMIGNYSVLRKCNINSMTSIGKNCTINYADIGKYCSISWMVTIGAINHHIERLTTNAFPYSKKLGIVDADELLTDRTVIGNDVWIGCNCVILPNVIIGDGAIIGAGSIVTKDVDPYTIVAGNPAKKVRDRFNEDIKKELIELKWWNFSDEIIKKYINFFRRKVDEELLYEVRNIVD